MNIFEQYLDKIKQILLDLSKNDKLVLPEKLNGITDPEEPRTFPNLTILTFVILFLFDIA